MQPSSDQVLHLVQLNATLKLARDAARSKRRAMKRNAVCAAAPADEKPTPQDLAEAEALEAAAQRAQAELNALVHSLFR